MPIRRSINAYRAATPFEQAGWTLAFTAIAIAVPAALRWLLASLADAAHGQTGYPAVAARTAVHATGQIVQWIGLAILAATALLCLWSAIAFARGTRERAGIPRWVVAETYAVGAVAALIGLAWLS